MKALTAATTPIGSRVVMARRPTDAAVRPMGTSSPWVRPTSSAHSSTPFTARAASPAASASGLPPSDAIRFASSSRRASSSAAARFNTAIRSWGASQASRSRNNDSATDSARSTSGADARSTVPTTNPEYGDRTSTGDDGPIIDGRSCRPAAW